jgi:hypothetical protein
MVHQDTVSGLVYGRMVSKLWGKNVERSYGGSSQAQACCQFDGTDEKVETPQSV